ncbi:MAG: ATP-binding protein, partial [Elusimicrobiota bacterium]
MEAAREEILRKEAGVRELRDRLLASFSPEGGAGPLPQAAFESELNDLVFGIAHQVRNPMGIIRSLAEDRLTGFWTSAKEKRTMEAILRAVENLRERLDQLVDFTRPVGLKLGRVEPRRLVEKAIAEVDAQCRARGIRIVRSVARGLPELKGDGERMREAVLNLLLNAVEAMPRGGTLGVGASQSEKEGTMTIEVSDTGGGVAPEHMKEVGRPFFTTKPGGVGLGVAIVKRIVAAHGGRFEFESKPGAG